MMYIFCFFKQKTAYGMRISDWSSDVCSSDLRALRNETGIKFTLDELRALVDIGSYDLIMQAEAEEIRQTWQKTPPRSLSGNTGSTKGGTAKPEMSGKLPDIPPSL